MSRKESFYSLQFGLLCLSGFLFFGSFNMIVPELPTYLEGMGGGEYKGLIIALFTITAGLSRPFSGKLADKVGRIPVMVVGALVSGISAMIYPFVTSIVGFFFLRFFHGFSTGFKPTGTAAYVADIVPTDRRGEAMGYIGFFSSLGMAVGPAIGSFIASNVSLEIMFYASSAFAILSVLILVGMKETLQNKERLSSTHFVIKKEDVFESRVIAPSVMMLFSVFPFGAILTLIPDVSDSLGISNRGLFFTCFTLSSLLARIFAGKISDKYGRIPVLKVGSFVLLLAMLLLANTDSQLMFVLSGLVFGIGVGIYSPTIYAWTIDLSDSRNIGRGIATMYIALEIGIGMGAFLSGWLYNNDLTRVSSVFYMSVVMVLIGIVYLYSDSAVKTKPQTVKNN